MYNADKTLYRDRSRVVEFYYNWNTNNKSCQIIGPLSTSTSIILVHKQFKQYSLPYIYVWLHLYREYTGIRENVNAMKQSIEPCLLQRRKRTFMHQPIWRGVTGVATSLSNKSKKQIILLKRKKRERVACLCIFLLKFFSATPPPLKNFWIRACL